MKYKMSWQVCEPSTILSLEYIMHNSLQFSIHEWSKYMNDQIASDPIILRIRYHIIVKVAKFKAFSMPLFLGKFALVVVGLNCSWSSCHHIIACITIITSKRH